MIAFKGTTVDLHLLSSTMWVQKTVMLFIVIHMKSDILDLFQDISNVICDFMNILRSPQDATHGSE